MSVTSPDALAVAEASLASLYALRSRLLPIVRAALPADADALAGLIANQRAEWIDAAYPAEKLPPAILRGNIAAFLLHALDLAQIPAKGRALLLAAWFTDPQSPLSGHARHDPARGRMVRLPCCLRDLAGIARCASCPRKPPRRRTSPMAGQPHTR